MASSTTLLSVPGLPGVFVAPQWSLTSANEPDAPGSLHTLTVTIASSYHALALVDRALSGLLHVCLSFWARTSEYGPDSVQFLPLRQIDLRRPSMRYAVVSSRTILQPNVGEPFPLLQLTFTGNVLAVHETFAKNRDPQDALPTPAVGGLPSFAVSTMFHTRQVHRVSRWDLFQHIDYSPRLHDLLEPGVRLAIREVLMIRRCRPEHPLSRVDLNVVFAICTHLLHGDWYCILRPAHTMTVSTAALALAQQQGIVRAVRAGDTTAPESALSNTTPRNSFRAATGFSFGARPPPTLFGAAPVGAVAAAAPTGAVAAAPATTGPATPFLFGAAPVGAVAAAAPTGAVAAAPVGAVAAAPAFRFSLAGPAEGGSPSLDRPTQQADSDQADT